MLTPREWVPDVNEMARQLIADYRRAESQAQGDLDALGTVGSWQEEASRHGETITEDDLVSVIQILGRTAAGRSAE